MARVEIVSPDEPGLGFMIGALLTAGVEDPKKAAILDEMHGIVSIDAYDADAQVALVFRNRVCRVYPRALPGSTVTLSMPGETLMAMSTMKTVGGLPDLRTPEARDFLKQIATRKVRISGFWHTKLLNQFSALMKL